MDEPASRPALLPEGGASHAALRAELDAIEILTRHDHDGAYDRAAAVVDAARSLGDVGIGLRAELVQADVLCRRGQLTAAGRIARAVNRWAERSGERYLQARSHLVLEQFSGMLGDTARALEHAVLAVQLLDDTAPPQAVVDHQLRLASAMATSGGLSGARPRYAMVIAAAERLGDMATVEIALNNLAWDEYSMGDPARAAEILERVQALACARGAALHPGVLDTMGRVLLALGRHAEAEETLLSLDPASGMSEVDIAGRTECLLTLATIQRTRGALDRAQGSVDVCVQLCEEAGLADMRAQAHGEQAEIHAAAGRYAEAFAEYKEFHTKTTALRSAENASHSRTVQAVFEASEARQEAQRYREMSLRDPLTGLHNRRFVEDELPRLLRSGASGVAAPLTVAFIDLDHFKTINDTCSHETGDQVLRAVAAMLAQQAAEYGGEAIAARVGGEEFLLVLPPMSAPAAFAALQDLRLAVADHPWWSLTGPVAVTVSIGATRVQPAEVGVEASVLFARADLHLYDAKRGGRNRVVIDSTAGCE